MWIGCTWYKIIKSKWRTQKCISDSSPYFLYYVVCDNIDIIPWSALLSFISFILTNSWCGLITFPPTPTFSPPVNTQNGKYITKTTLNWKTKTVYKEPKNIEKIYNSMNIRLSIFWSHIKFDLKSLWNHKKTTEKPWEGLDMDIACTS